VRESIKKHEKEEMITTTEEERDVIEARREKGSCGGQVRIER